MSFDDIIITNWIKLYDCIDRNTCHNTFINTFSGVYKIIGIKKIKLSNKITVYELINH